MAQQVDMHSRGGSMGRYEGWTPAQIAEKFEACVADPSMRSVTAILRITREQLESRGSLGSYPYIAVVIALFTVAAFAVGRVYPDFESQSQTLAMGSGIFLLIVLVGIWHVRRERRIAVAQEREIRRMAADALARLLAHDFRRKPLEREHILTLRDLIRREPRPGLERLLQEE
ncbi:MAG: hypothetical protein ACO1SV_01260 [Fimbriimonas sp.]